MKPLLSVGLVCLILISVQAQERITELITRGTNVEYINKEINGLNYLIKIYQNDTLEVYQLENVNDGFLLHKNHFEGFYNNNRRNQIWIDGKLCFDNKQGIIAYDIRNNSYQVTQVPEDLYLSYFSPSVQSQNIVFASLQNQYRDTILSTFYSPGESLKIIDDFANHFNFPYYVTRDLNNDQSKRSYFLHNYHNNEIDTLFIDIDINKDFGWYKDELLYLNTQGDLELYDPINKTKRVLPNIHFESKTSLEIFVKNSKLIMSINLNRSAEVIFLYDIEKEEVIWDFELLPQPSPHPILNFSAYIVDLIDNTIIMNDFGSAVLINTETDSLQWIECPGNLNQSFCEAIDSIWFGTYAYNSQKELLEIQLTSLDDFNKKVYTIPEISPQIQYYDYQSVGEKYLFNFPSTKKDAYPLQALDIAIPNTNPILNFDNSTSGFKPSSEIIKVGNDIMVLSDMIYSIQNDELKELRLDIDEFDHLVIEDELYLIEDYGNVLYKYNENLDTVINFSEFGIRPDIDSSNDLAILTDYIIFLGSEEWNFNIYKYHKPTRTVSVLFPNSSNFIFEILFQYDNWLIIRDGLDIYHYNAINDTKLYISQYSIVSEKYQNEYLYTIDNDLYTINGEGDIRLIEEDFVFDNYVRSISDDSGENLIFFNSSDFYHYNGDSITPYNLTPNENLQIETGSDGIFLMNQSIKRIFDSKNNNLIELPNFFGPDISIRNYLEIGEEKFLFVTKNALRSTGELRIYRTNDGFTNFELVYTMCNTAGPNLDFTYIKGNQGIFRFGEVFFVVDKDNNFSLLPDINNEIYQVNNSIATHDHVYFFGQDIKYGQQVYKWNPISTAIEKPIISKIDYYKLFPNPSKDRLNITRIFNSSKMINYQIIGSTGKLIDKGITSQEINLSRLKNGIYFLRLSDNEVERTLKFQVLK